MRILSVPTLLLLTACQASGPVLSDLSNTTAARLPAPVTNNAVARIETHGRTFLLSFAGLQAGKGHEDTTAAVYQRELEAGDWREIGALPDRLGRLASIAVGVSGEAYIFGGYTVAEDGSEVSTPEVWSYDPQSAMFVPLAPMPVPVDDAVAVTYQDRYIYLVSGWHDLANVNLVQRYDIETNSWTQATPWPGAGVFGHAGGIVGNTMIICDGVVVRIGADGPRRFEATDACYRGTIRADDPRRIDWHTLPPHPVGARYRMAATGSDALNAVVFAGGSDNPYNYDGMGYDGKPSAASADVFRFDLDSNAWRRDGAMTTATMDHRGLLEIDSDEDSATFAIVGGMVDPQRVSDAEFHLTLERR